MPTAMAEPCSCGMGGQMAGSCQHCDRGCVFCETFQYTKCERNKQYNLRTNARLKLLLPLPINGGLEPFVV